MAMRVKSESIRVNTKGYNDVHDLTGIVREIVERSGLSDGLATVFVPGSTAGVTTIEFEGGVVEDLRQAFDRLVPAGITYRHDDRWGDGNGFSHVRAALCGPSITVPFSGATLALGTWQQIILVDFDNRPRSREVRIQIMGE